MRYVRVRTGCLGWLFLGPLFLMFYLFYAGALLAVVGFSLALWAVAGTALAIDWALRKSIPRYRARRALQPLKWPAALTRSASVGPEGLKSNRRRVTAGARPIAANQQVIAVAAPVAPPGWHADPLQPQRLRWWDGTQWTDHVHAP